MPPRNLKTTAKVVVSFSILFGTIYVVGRQINKPTYAPVYSNGFLNKDIIKLAKIQNPTATLPASGFLIAWNTYLQSNFLRPAGIDHQDMANMKQDSKHAQMTPLFVALGMVHDINPSRKTYQHIFIFGGTLTSDLSFCKKILMTKKLMLPRM